jgi:hypothetical protein
MTAAGMIEKARAVAAAGDLEASAVLHSDLLKADLTEAEKVEVRDLMIENGTKLWDKVAWQAQLHS